MRGSELRRFAAFSCIGTVGLMPLLVLPAMIGVLVDRGGLGESAAGWSASIHFIGSACIGMLMSLRMHHLNLRKVATIALALAIVADLASAATAGPGPMFFAARGAAGVALGAAYVCASSAFSRFEDYERGFGLFVTLQFIVSGIGLYVVPVFSAELGAHGLFIAFAVLDFLALLLVRFLPDTIPARESSGGPASELRVLLTPVVLTAVVAYTLFEAANNAQFTYIERFGVALGISDHDLGVSLLVASLLGIPAAFTMVVVGLRFGTLRPLTLGIALSLAGLAVLLSSASYAMYFAGGCLMGFSWAFCLPYIQSLLASLDRSGSAIAAGTSLSTLGSALGPGLAALVIGEQSYGNVFMLSVALFFLSCIGFWHSAGRQDRNRAETAA